MKPRLTVVTLGVDDLEGAVAFLSRRLGSFGSPTGRRSSSMPPASRRRASEAAAGSLHPSLGSIVVAARRLKVLSAGTLVAPSEFLEEEQ